MIHTYESDIYTAMCERATLCCPPEAVLEDPCIKVVLGCFSETEIGSGDTLEDVVIVLGRTENARGWIRDIPGGCQLKWENVKLGGRTHTRQRQRLMLSKT